jgi:serine/threonine protein kinase
LPPGVNFIILNHACIMEERYEIRGKIGQGGLGAVYRGYDTRMSREVAIKRISAATGDKELLEESTRQLIKEAGALASLQHPHIVTIYDVGSDEDGPYVVMELISGKTLDELIERAPLTWPDFRELAMQTQEALIAAQELDLIHSDIKPSNLMLTWLPSGKFQVKIVDFGLATLTHAQSKEDIEMLEAVFGSIFFMAPEQFERVPLDARTDMYAMGCVYYQALTGQYPFDGQTGTEVMNAHLQHAVTPIQDVRSDIPIWVCDWIMWQINRMPLDRPGSARECLQVFLQNDKAPNPKMSLGAPPPTQSMPQRPQLGVRGGGPQPILIPRPSGPLSRTQQATAEWNLPIPVPTVGPLTTRLAQPDATKTTTAPQPLMPPEGSKPSVHTSLQQLPDANQTLTQVVQLAPAQIIAAHTGPVRIVATNPIPEEFLHPKKRGLGKKEKTMISAVLGVAVLIFLIFLMKMGGKKDTQVLVQLLAEAGQADATQLMVDRAKLNALLETTAGATDPQRTLVLRALSLAKASDATDVDGIITEFAVGEAALTSETRENLFREVLRKRRNPASVPALLAFANSTKEPRLAAAALDAVRFTANEDHLPVFIEIITTTFSAETRKAAEESLAELIRRSKLPSAIRNPLLAAYKANKTAEIRHCLLRLLARCGGDASLQLVKESLESADPQNQIVGLTALGLWADDSAFTVLIGFIKSTTSETLRSQAFDAAYRFVSEPKRTRKPAATEDLWDQVAGLAKTPDEQKNVITGLVDYGSETWAYRLIDVFGKNTKNDASVIELAERTLNRLRSRN